MEIYAIHEYLIPFISGQVPEEKWMRFFKIGHLIANVCERVCIELTRYDFLEIFFPLSTTPPQNSNNCIMCIRWLPKTRHFVQLYLKPGCPIPLTSPEWSTHSTREAETGPDHFLNRMQEFTKLSKIKRETNKQKSKAVPHIDLDGDTFDLFYFLFNNVFIWLDMFCM